MENAVLLNPTKTEAVVFGTRQRLCHIVRPVAVDIAGTKVTLSDSVKLLGVNLDSTLSFDKHVSDIVRSCYFHIRALIGVNILAHICHWTLLYRLVCVS